MSWLSVFKTEKPGIGFWFNIYISEDMYFVTKGLKEKHNHKRKKRLSIILTLLKWDFFIEIPLKKVGNIYYGRKMK